MHRTLTLLIPALVFSARAFSENVWTQKASMPGVMAWGTSFSIGHKGYVGIGVNMGRAKLTNAFWEWNKTTNTWTQKAAFPGEERIRPFGFSIGTKGYMGFGYDGGNKVFKDFWQWDQATNKWTRLKDFPGKARDGAGEFVIGSKAYIGTGWDGMSYDQSSYLTDFWEWDQPTDTWTRKANFPGLGRYIVSSFSVDGKGYFTGGGSAHWKYNNDTWQYDPVANSWKSVGAYGKAHVSDAAFTVNGKGYVSCGAETSTAFKNDCWEWDPAVSKWKECKKLPFSPRIGIMPFAIGNYGYLAGGVNQDLKHLNELWEFGPAVPPVEKPKAEVPPVAVVPPVKQDKQQEAVLPDPAPQSTALFGGMIIIDEIPPPAPESTYVAPQAEPAEILITEETNIKEDITLLFYPNPFTDEATVVLSREMEAASLQVFDLTGKLIKEFVFSGKETRIDRVNMDCGTYFYSVSEKGKMIGSGKFIVQ